MLGEDNYRHKGLRNKLVQELKDLGIKDDSVLKAISEIPRHFFMSSAFLNYAYENKAFQIGAGQTISQPYTVARQTELLELTRGQKVLEIGTGSGYQTCVLCHLGAKVFSIERQRLLHDNSKEIIKALNYRPNLKYGDGFKGIPAFAPFDKVLITCGAPFVPPLLVQQLKVGGKMIIPVGEGKTQTMCEIIKHTETEIETIEHGTFAFVPMLENRSASK